MVRIVAPPLQPRVRRVDQYQIATAMMITSTMTHDHLASGLPASGADAGADGAGAGVEAGAGVAGAGVAGAGAGAGVGLGVGGVGVCARAAWDLGWRGLLGGYRPNQDAGN